MGGGREGGVGCDREITWFTYMYSPVKEGRQKEGKGQFVARRGKPPLFASHRPSAGSCLTL